MPTVAFCCSFNSLDIFNDCLCKFEQFCALFFCLDLYCLVYCSLIDQLDDLQYYWFLILYFRELPKNMKPTINVANIPSAITQRSCWASKKKNFVVKFSMNTVTFLLVHSWRGVRNQSSKCSREIELTVSQMTHPSQSFFRAFFDQVIIIVNIGTPMLNLSRVHLLDHGQIDTTTTTGFLYIVVLTIPQEILIHPNLWFLFKCTCKI